MATAPSLLVSIAGTQEALGDSGRTKIYELIKNGELAPVKIGRRTFVTRASIEAYVGRLAARAGEPLEAR